jgi:hypothetical protein
MLTFREVLQVLDRQDGMLGDVKVSDVMEASPFTPIRT